jgi:hypothetical protein
MPNLPGGYRDPSDCQPEDMEVEYEVVRLCALLAEARAALAPFAAIKPSTLCAADGIDGEGYGAWRAETTMCHVDFTGIDLARARKFMEDTADHG